MTTKSIPDPAAPEMRVFDQTNGLLAEDPEVLQRPRTGPGAARGDVPGATHLLLGL